MLPLKDQVSQDRFEGGSALLKLNKKDESGFTLVELLISITISALLVLGIASMVEVLQNNFRPNQSTNETQQSVYLGMNLLIRELREARSLVPGSNASRLIFVNVAGNTITYQLNSVPGTLTRTVSGGNSAIVANGIDFTAIGGVIPSRFIYDNSTPAQVRLITICLKADIGGKQLSVQNSVRPRNFL